MSRRCPPRRTARITRDRPCEGVPAGGDRVGTAAGDEDEIRDLVEQHLTDIIAGTAGLTQAPPTTDYLPFVDDTEAIQDGRRLGLTYGFADLDALTSGMQPGSVTVVAAQSGVGKSTLALNATVAAAKTGAKVMFSSLEMSSTEIMSRA
ncbi:DnaB-like helicase C-terminal domain-containing protein [Streptomyces sp900105245]|uniref:DnaB-like helicase C-terminal domain-containing protein n=1 Tax=Streptomyces sp. 900105245 TaxID=3154379 RepID=A0ABV1UKB6_9ACTN